jgi:predicted TPR repeat methyltransferase/Tfp pilus assembly protein PilF
MHKEDGAPVALLLAADIEQAESLLLRGELHEAADICKRILEQNPAFAPGYCLMSALFRSTGNYDKALHFSDLAIQLDPQNASFYLHHGQIHAATENWDKAAECFSQAYGMDTQNVRALLLWGNSLTHLKYYDDAMEKFSRARLRSDSSEIDEYEGACLLEQGNLTAAEQLFDRMINIDPQNARAHLLKGHLLFGQQMEQQAMVSFVRAYKLAPQAHDALHGMALLSARGGDMQAAVDYAMRAVQVNPSLFSSLILLGVLLNYVHDDVSAEAVFRQSMILRPVGEALECTLRSLLNRGLFAQAKEQLQQVSPEHAQHPVVAFWRAAVLSQHPPAPPEGYIAERYNGYAQHFLHILHKNKHSDVPQAFQEALYTLPGFAITQSTSVLDIGCGAGRMAEKMKLPAHVCVGVDLSEKMLGSARIKQLYDQLHHCDMVEFLNGSERCFDILIAADVLYHLGDLSSFLTGARMAMHPSSVLICNFLREESMFDYRLGAGGYYTHNPRYLERLTKEHGYQTLYIHDMLQAQGLNQLASSQLVILQKEPLH